MPFAQRYIEPKFLSRTALFDENGKPLVSDEELEAVTNNTLSNALRQLASLALIANDIFTELGKQLQNINKRSKNLKVKINLVEEKVEQYDPKKVTVPESDICTFALLKNHFAAKQNADTSLFTADTRPQALKVLYESATKTPVHLMRQMDRWRRDGLRSSRFFVCTPVLGAKRRRIRNKENIDIETRIPAVVEELRRWTSDEALGDITVNPDCYNRIIPNGTLTDGDATDGTIGSDDEGIDHKLPSPEEQLQVVALKFPAEVVAVDVSGRSFDRMSIQRRSLLHADVSTRTEVDPNTLKRRTRTRRPRSRRRNTLAGTDQKEIRDALAGEEAPSPTFTLETESTSTGAVSRSKSSDLLRSTNKKDSLEKKSHFNSLKQWGKNRYDRLMNKSSESKTDKKEDVDDFNIYETVTMKRRRDVDKNRKTHERNSSVSSSEKSSINLPLATPLSSAVMNIAVKLRESSAQRRERRSGGNKDEPHSSSGNWSASSESGRASIGSEITTTTQPKSTTSAATSNNSLNQQPPSSVNSRRRFNINTSNGSVTTSEGTLTPDIINDLHEDGETSSVYSCDTEGYYTSFHMDSGLKTLKEEDLPSSPIHSTTAFSNSGSNNTVVSAENEYELFGKGSTSTTTSSAGTVCTTLRASESNRSLIIGPAVPERKSSLSKLSNKDNKSPESSLERDMTSEKTGTVKRSPAANKPIVVAMIHKQNNGDVSPDSGHNTSSSPIESEPISSPNGVRSGSDFEFSESSDMEGPERIERIRVKTTINSSRIPSMCVITPPHSDDEDCVNPHTYSRGLTEINNAINFGSKNSFRNNLELPLKNQSNVPTNELKSTDSDKENFLPPHVMSHGSKVSLVNVDPQTGYATVQTVDEVDTKINVNVMRSIRAASPSGGTVTVKEEVNITRAVASQPVIKTSLLPLNNMFGKLKTNIASLTNRKDSKSPNRSSETAEVPFDSGEYVTIADVRNNNEKVCKNTEQLIYANDVVNKNLNTVLSGMIRESEYISLDELPCNDSQQNPDVANNNALDSLERKRRLGARVTLDAEGKVVYSSDSLRRQKTAHSTFEPGPFVKPSNSPCSSPLPVHRTAKTIRPVANTQNQRAASVPSTEFNRPLSPQPGKIVIRAASGLSSPTSEIVRLPASTIVAPTARPKSPKAVGPRGAYVHMQDTGRPQSPTQEKDRVPTPSSPPVNRRTFENQNQEGLHITKDMYRYTDPILDDQIEPRYFQPRGNMMYQTLPAKKTQFFYNEANSERSVTPDITRGLERNYNSMDRRLGSGLRGYDGGMRHDQYVQRMGRNDQNDFHKLGIPVETPQISPVPWQYAAQSSTPTKIIKQTETPTYSPITRYTSPATINKHVEVSCDSIKISPIDPRNSGGFKSSTPSAKNPQDLKAASNLENILMSPKKSTMSNEELYTIIHKSKKKMNIDSEEPPVYPTKISETKQSVKSPETGYLGEKSRSRLSWSPNKGEYIDFNADIDKLSPPKDSRSRQSWACNDRKGTQQTSRLDFKRLLLQKTNFLGGSSKKMSAVEQLKLSKQQIQAKTSAPPTQEMSILELSGSPRSLVSRKFVANPPGSPSRATPEKLKPAPKILSPRSQWRFASPRSDVLSSTILEDCREDESPNNSNEKMPNTLENRISTQSTNDNKQENSIPDPKTAQSQPYTSISQRLQAQRAQFFNSRAVNADSKNVSPQNAANLPTLETAF